MSFNKLNRGERLIDPLGRQITYLRVSTTQRCNLKCGYCIGSAGVSLAKNQELSIGEILSLLEIFSSLGIDKIRFTGGEPLLRNGIIDLVKQTSEIAGISLIGLTTNGLTLDLHLAPLLDAGLNRLNVSLDSLNRSTFKMITGIDGFDRVYSGIIDAEASGVFSHIKVNTVVMRGINDEEIPQFAEWALNRKIDLRLIEFMPTLKSGWDRELFVGEDEIRARVGLGFEKEFENDERSGPAVSYRFRDYPGRVSFISAVSRSFCNRCNRLRLTSGGNLIGCLFQSNYYNLRVALNKGANRKKIAYSIRSIVNSPGFRRVPEAVSVSEDKPVMREVGG